jgi:hypothetical protein
MRRRRRIEEEVWEILNYGSDVVFERENERLGDWDGVSGRFG